MASSSPEYHITKVGMDAHPRKRDRPTRTYGKRPAEPRSDDGQAKKRKVGDGLRSPNSATVAVKDLASSSTGESAGSHKSTTHSSVSSSSPAPRSTEANSDIKKSSIMRYFKPALSSSSRGSSATCSSSPLQSPSGPSSSPPAPRGKKRQLLRVRPANSPPPETISENTSERNAASHCNAAKESQPPNPPSREGLHEASESLHNQQQPGHGPRQDPTSSGAQKRKRTAPTVQMTLNISSKAAFSECKVCDSVWNPLYPDDVKYHTKRHATVVRAAKKKAMLEL